MKEVNDAREMYFKGVKDAAAVARQFAQRWYKEQDPYKFEAAGEINQAILALTVSEHERSDRHR